MVFRTCQLNEFYSLHDTKLHTQQGTKEINTLVSMAFWTYMTTLHTPQATKEINTLVSVAFWTYMTTLHTPQATKEINTLVPSPWRSGLVSWTNFTAYMTQGSILHKRLKLMNKHPCIHGVLDLHDNAPYSTRDKRNKHPCIHGVLDLSAERILPLTWQHSILHKGLKK